MKPLKYYPRNLSVIETHYINFYRKFKLWLLVFLKIQVLVKTNNQYTNKDIKLQKYDTLESNYLNRET